MSKSASIGSATGAHEKNQNLILGALGVVFGDIGTSPLYTLQQCMRETGDVTLHGIMGILSLIVWALISVVTIKYVLVVMRADNRGEGGILALTALALRGVPARSKTAALVLAAGMAGAALFYGDGVITPAISVLSAVEGLKVIAPGLEPFVLPLTVLLLVGLFAMQKRGTAAVGRYFGPITALWFAALAAAGIYQLWLNPETLSALNPAWGVELLYRHPWKGFVLLGAVVLAVTGAEALYADMGHFGRKPINRAWLYLVFPALLLNYFGQGAHLLSDPQAIDNPFYRLYPTWALIPMVVLASAATIIASQAVISAAAANPPYLGPGTRPGLRPEDKFPAAGGRRLARPRIQVVQQSGRGLWHRGHRDHEPDHDPGLHLYGQGAPLESVARFSPVRRLPYRRRRLLQRQHIEGGRRRLGAALDRYRHLRRHVHLDQGPGRAHGQASGREPAAGTVPQGLEARPSDAGQGNRAVPDCRCRQGAHIPVAQFEAQQGSA